MICNCPVCNGRDPNNIGFYFAMNEVFPFVKKVLLKIGNINHPFPMKYKGFTDSLLAYGQAIYYDRTHNPSCKRTYYTDNEWMLKFRNELNEKFPEVIITSLSELIDDQDVQEVCEFNVS